MGCCVDMPPGPHLLALHVRQVRDAGRCVYHPHRAVKLGERGAVAYRISSPDTPWQLFSGNDTLENGMYALRATETDPLDNSSWMSDPFYADSAWETSFVAGPQCDTLPPTGDGSAWLFLDSCQRLDTPVDVWVRITFVVRK